MESIQEIATHMFCVVTTASDCPVSCPTPPWCSLSHSHKQIDIRTSGVLSFPTKMEPLPLVPWVCINDIGLVSRWGTVPTATIGFGIFRESAIADRKSPLYTNFHYDTSRF
jgi:hypothetical protein